MVEELINNLKTIISGHKMLNQLAAAKIQVIKDGDVKQLNQIINQEEKVICRIRQLEKDREMIVKAILQKKNVSGEHTPALTEILAYIPSVYHHQLKQLRGELVQQIESLKETNDLNQQLLRQSLQWVHLNINLLQPQPTLNNYQHPGKALGGQPMLSRIDSRA
ncbi:flagellar protein FlgN [Scopulibacillus cellulosilyticus]|uniref:Flagellar protein FlgN n=1 Tax=Scopulibacillus cellulosilyticus TaxID=2665665 RepID=A0ABW2PXF2_9BACL